MMCKVLIFGCIAAVILMTAAYGAPLTTEIPSAQPEQLLRASIQDLEELKNIKNNFLDFYTPNDKQECNRTTLECYLTELKVLKEDVEEEKQRHIINIEKNLNYFKQESYAKSKKFPVLQVGNSSNLTCKKCESNEKKKFAEFRQELISFLQSMLK
ncbi:IL15 protein, partial [Lanius ludovicianus]|nr:IL15 protein [Lanius ludovicianus]